MGILERYATSKAVFGQLGKAIGYPQSRKMTLLTLEQFSSAEDWRLLTHRTVIQNGGRGILSHYSNSIANMLSAVYPEHYGHVHRFARSPRTVPAKTQHLLMKRVSALLGNITIQFNAKNTDWIFPVTKSRFELGIPNKEFNSTNQLTMLSLQ